MIFLAGGPSLCFPVLLFALIHLYFLVLAGAGAKTREAVFPFLLAVARFAQQSLLSIIQAVNCCFEGLQGGELCYQAVSLFSNFCFTVFWLLMFRQYWLLVLKAFPWSLSCEGEAVCP